MSENWAPSVGDLREIYAAYITRNHDSYTSGISLEDARDVYRSQFYRAIAAHDAELREQIARDIENVMNTTIGNDGWEVGMESAADIARGKASWWVG